MNDIKVLLEENKRLKQENKKLKEIIKSNGSDIPQYQRGDK